MEAPTSEAPASESRLGRLLGKGRSTARAPHAPLEPAEKIDEIELNLARAEDSWVADVVSDSAARASHPYLAAWETAVDRNDARRAEGDRAVRTWKTRVAQWWQVRKERLARRTG
ncbi:MAG TPA: hypothetical protein VFA56_12290 [Gaiellaceae bacterium]|nr:hypothetical protein [Gaiellaceae bacterium]